MPSRDARGSTAREGWPSPKNRWRRSVRCSSRSPCVWDGSRIRASQIAGQSAKTDYFVKLCFMINDLKRLALFAEVVRAGSLTAAARRLRISTSAVSQQLRALEQAHGVTLLHRSTRKISLTDAGARLDRKSVV